MRSLIAVATAVAIVVAGFPTVPGFTQSAGTPALANASATQNPTPTQNTAIAALFKAFPNGGEKLSGQIADFIVSNPKLAPALANYVVKTPSLNIAQKRAAERGMAAALERLGINAADMPLPTKAPQLEPVVEEGFNPLWLLLAAAVIAGIVVCVLECGPGHGHGPTIHTVPTG